ncbi:MAG: HAMP domain-containing histidine kinase [Deltaproteobacteria bacterium]|nr:HAMP domain-containing histidine kinase [Deltaproteobacteria bacterium]
MLRWSRLIRRLSWVTHPITIFVSLQVVWLAITLIWVIWFVTERAEIGALARRFGQEYFSTEITVAILVVGCILLGVLLVGTILLFVAGQRQSSAARQQRTFVSSVTHELKSPLASLQLAFETMMTHQLDPPTRTRIADMIYSDIDRLRRLIDQILVAGRLDRGILSFDDASSVVPMDDLINKIVDKLSYMDPDLRTRLSIDCPPRLTLRASRMALSLILNNLVENSIKYSPRQSPIKIGFDQRGRDVFMYVQDQGIGLDKKDMKRLFKLFRRGEAAVKKAIPGTGLGLYIVKSAVRVLGGRVWAESAGGGTGSTFYVSLPTEQKE